FGSAVGPCEQRILSGQCDRADGPFDNVVVEFDAAVVDEEPEAFPSRQGIADGHGQFALLADQRELCPTPWLERVDQTSAFLLSNDTPFVGASTADVFLNGIELGNQLKRFAGGWRRPGRCQFIEAAPDVGPAEGKPDVVAPGELTVTGITVDLQDSREALEMTYRTFRRAVGCVDIGNTRRIGSAPWPVVGGVGPELAGFRAAAAGIQHRRRRLVGKQPRPLL